MASLASLVVRFRVTILILALIFIVAASLLAPGMLDSLTQTGFDNRNSEAYRAQTTLISEMGVGGDDLVILYYHPELLANDEAFAGAVNAAVKRLEQSDLVASAISIYSTGDRSLVSRDGHYAAVLVSLRGGGEERLDTFDDLSRAATADGLETSVGGMLALEHSVDEISDKDLRRAELIALPLILVLMLYVFRGVVAAFLPVFIGVLNIVTASVAVGALGKVTEVSSLALTPITMLGLGLSVDYALLIVSRYREEIKSSDAKTAIARTLNTAGRTVILAALVVSLSTVGLLLFPYVFLRSLAIGAVVTTITAAFWSLTILPALLALLGRNIDALRLPLMRERTAGGPDQWDRFSGFVMRFAAPLAVVTGAALLIFAVPSLGMKLHDNHPQMVPADVGARRVFDIMNSPDNFEAGTATPIVASVKIDESVPGPGVASATDMLVSKLTELAHVRQVALFPNPRSELSMPAVSPESIPEGADAPDVTGVTSPTGEGQAPAGVLPAPVTPGSTIMLTMRADTEPFSAESRELIRSIRAIDVPGITLQVGGMAASYEDNRDTIFDTLPYLFAIIIGVVFLVMFVLLRSVLVPLKAIAVGALSLTASYGFLVWGFQEANLGGLLNFEGVPGVHLTLPILLFPVAFALTMDYEIFLLTRVREEFDRTDDNVKSIRLGLQRAGRVITGAAVILIVVFAAFSTGSLLYIKEIGLTLAFAIAIDATIVRLVLVPAAMKLMGRANWWSPVAARPFSGSPVSAEASGISPDS